MLVEGLIEKEIGMPHIEDPWLQPSRCSDSPMTPEDLEETLILLTEVTGDDWRAIFRGLEGAKD
jgi:hypothetical protein